MGKGEHFFDMETLQLIVDHCNIIKQEICHYSCQDGEEKATQGVVHV